ncbi:MAG: hypothetical protein HY290_00895 [Planctomycetia bacterium]|nr:hypothetical protein [Planctomycetia bacterium]
MTTRQKFRFASTGAMLITAVGFALADVNPLVPMVAIIVGTLLYFALLFVGDFWPESEVNTPAQTSDSPPESP